MANACEIDFRCSFYPDDDSSQSALLLEELWRLRQATLLALTTRLQHHLPDLFVHTGMRGRVEAFRELPQSVRRRFIEYPPLRIWLKRTLRAAQQPGIPELSSRLVDFARVLDTFQSEEANPHAPRIEGTMVELRRFDVDPLVRESVPPSYRFPDEAKQAVMCEGRVYTLPVFLDIVTAALGLIGDAWPAAYRDFARFVNTIIHLPDGTFRSCSADRYVGVILLAAGDESLLDLEESLIHEFGHQILYNIMEIDPLVVNPPDRQFVLPWSGQLRDFYGYFHAFYVYILLVRYFDRVEGGLRRRQQRRRKRIADIMMGLRTATSELRALDLFTPRGRMIFTCLECEVRELERRHEGLLRNKKAAAASSRIGGGFEDKYAATT